MDRLKEIRKMRGFTLKEVERHTGILHATLSRYENHKIEPTINNIIKLANFYKVCVDYLIGAELCSCYGILNKNEEKA